MQAEPGDACGPAGATEGLHPVCPMPTGPQRYLVTVGIDAPSTICRMWRVAARIDNTWHIANGEQARTIDICTLRRPLGDLWSSLIARSKL